MVRSSTVLFNFLHGVSGSGCSCIVLGVEALIFDVLWVDFIEVLSVVNGSLHSL